MSSPPPATALYTFGWLYIDGNIIQNGVDGYTYDRQMCRLIKLYVTLNYKQLCDIICAKLKIDANLYRLKIMHRCFNPLTKMFAVAPILDDDDVELMFELVVSSGVQNSVVELYLEKVLRDDALVGGVAVAALNSLTVRAAPVEKVVIMSQDVEKRGENVEVSEDGDESGGSSKQTLYKQFVGKQGKNITRGGKKGGDSGKPLWRGIEGSFKVGSNKEPVFTTMGDVLHVTDLKKGMVFATRDELAEIVNHVHIRNHQQVKAVRKNSCRFTVQCKRRADGCIWSLRATKRKRHGCFEIMKIWGTHTCVNPNITEDHADSMICPNVEEVPDARVFVEC